MPKRLITPSQLSLFSISPVIWAWWQELEARNLFDSMRPQLSAFTQYLWKVVGSPRLASCIANTVTEAQQINRLCEVMA